MKTIYDVVEYMKKERVNPLTVDAWETGTNKEIYNILKDAYKQTNEILCLKYKIQITHTPGRGFGMGEEAPEYTIAVLLNF